MTPSNRPVFARFYTKFSHLMDVELATHRHSQLNDLHGRVLEVGCGNGLNFRHYPPTVDRVTAVEPEPRLRRLAVTAALEATVPIKVIDGIAEDLPVETAAYDVVVTTLVLCSVSNPTAAVGEICRVLRPGGLFRFLEHVKAESRMLALIQQLADATVWPLLVGGCHTHRDTETTIRQSGLVITELAPIRFPDQRIPVPTTPHILGTAVHHAEGSSHMDAPGRGLFHRDR